MHHGLIFWIIVGIIAGFLARATVPSAEGRGGLIVDLIVGLIGALLGGWVFSLLGLVNGGGIIWSTVVAFVGAVILLFIVRAVTGRGRTAV
jgi:uncharacterized membrane protein YeaQ/YmgE (transglycosylase-associated protein family)